MSAQRERVSGPPGSPGDEEVGANRRVTSRPWSVAAAMEPVPPLAPPPARPGKGAVVIVAPRPSPERAGPRTLLAIATLYVTVAVIVIVLLVSGR